ncbi:hypothetical protein ACFQZC_34695 [Streptacidiphilus monticola]
MITGWGVAESVRHYYATYGGELAGKRVVVQGWGNVGAAAAYYAARAGRGSSASSTATAGSSCRRAWARRRSASCS